MFSFLLAATALLAAPGPSNTLIALAAAQGGRAIGMLPLVLGAYLAMVVPFSLIGAELTQSFPLFALGLKGFAALWVMYLAVKLWRGSKQVGERPVRAWDVIATTILNPKSLVIGLVLLPQPKDAEYLAHLFALAVVILMTGALWAGLGRALTRLARGEAVMSLFARVAAFWLALVSLGLASSLIRAAIS